MKYSFVTSRAPRVGCIAITEPVRKPRGRRAKSKKKTIDLQSILPGGKASLSNCRLLGHVWTGPCLNQPRMSLRMIGTSLDFRIIKKRNLHMNVWRGYFHFHGSVSTGKLGRMP